MPKIIKRKISKDDPQRMPIVIEYERFINAFDKNSNKEKYFKNDEIGYWSLINKALNVAIKMAEHYQNNTASYSNRDKITISGGGGGGDVSNLTLFHDINSWLATPGSVHINFKTKEITVEHEDIPISKPRYQYDGIPYEEFYVFLKQHEFNPPLNKNDKSNINDTYFLEDVPILDVICLNDKGEELWPFTIFYKAFKVGDEFVDDTVRYKVLKVNEVEKVITVQTIPDTSKEI